MPRLGVNIDHVATLRQARGGTDPDPLAAAVLVELAGADGIVVHLREDRRHIQDRDLQLLRELIRTKLDLEMAADETMAKIALTIKPDMVTLVPEKRQELTTEGGLDVAGLAAVINVDVTPDAEIHVHRIGRTGRAGETGLALSFASLDEMGAVGRIELLQGRESKWHPLAELTPQTGERLLPAMATIHILGGRKEKIRPGDVLGALTKDLGFAGAQIGKINVNEFSTYVAVEREIAAEVLGKLSGAKVKGRSVKVRLLDD